MKITPGMAAVTTGGASGLGYASAKALADAGVKVAIFDMNPEKGEAVAKELGGVFCEANVTSEDAMIAAFAKARAAHGQERILVSCAGSGKTAKTISKDRETGALKRYPSEWFDMVCQINLIGSFRTAAMAAEGMVTLDPLEDGERGVITFTGSVAAQDGQIGQVSYAASKAGIAGMTLPLARDLSGDGIRVNTILPGTFATPPMMNVPAPVLESLAAAVPFPKRLGKPEEYASLVMELVRNTYFNAQVIRLDGAIRMAPR